MVGLSEKLLYYSNVFDVLAQHHPEYVALAWGTLKFLFIVCAVTLRFPPRAVGGICRATPSTH